MSDEEIRSRLTELEDRLENLQDAIESCRKGMLLARVAILAGSVLFVINLIGLIAPSLLLALFAFTAIIGGIVWLGANKTSRDEALIKLRSAQAEWRAETDAIDMSTIGG
ncbi:MAG: hypothetical protein QOF41_3338 [Methylobacteriaceae bacterium]|nr:hypothetical protein [Methylobacteriaceae bacterium]